MNTLLWKRTSFDENWHKWSKWQRHGMVKFWGQEVKRHRKPKIDLKAWWRHRSGLPWLEYHLLVIFGFCYSQIICKTVTHVELLSVLRGCICDMKTILLQDVLLVLGAGLAFVVAVYFIFYIYLLPSSNSD